MNKKGFTLVEMITVIAIIGIILTISLGNTQTLKVKGLVSAASNQILDVGKEVRQKSVSVEEFRDGIFPSYGLLFDLGNNSEIIVFANCAPDSNEDGRINGLDNFQYDASETACSSPGVVDGPSLVKTISLTHGTKIKKITTIYPQNIPNDTEVEDTVAAIAFLRPEPTIWISHGESIDNSNLITAGRVEITVSDINETLEETVVFVSTGLIFIK